MTYAGFDGTHATTPYRSPAEVLGIQASADLLWRWLQTRDGAYVDLYRGLCLTELSRTRAHIEWRTRTAGVVAAVCQAHAPSAAQLGALTSLVEGVHRALPSQREALTEARILFVGDCLFEEVALFLAPQLIGDGLLLRPEHIVTRNPLEQRQQIRSLDPASFLAVFYSPFSYGFNRNYAQVLKPSRGRLGRNEVHQIVEQSARAVGPTIDELARIFSCPVFVSNSSTVQRGTSFPRRVIKAALTAATRRAARDQVNTWLTGYLAERRYDATGHLYVLDEAALVPPNILQGGLGTYLHTSDSLHPTRFSHALAEAVADQVRAVTLRTRKLIVHDDTLTQAITVLSAGRSKELPVVATLRRLRARGIVTAVVPDGVPQRSRESGTVPAPRVVSARSSDRDGAVVPDVGRLLAEMNVRSDDTIYLGGTSSARDAVRHAWPAMTIADPHDARTWRVLTLLADMLAVEQEFDRGEMYRQRSERTAFMSDAQLDEDATEMFSRLELRATLTPLAAAGVPRATELINRTNQWNLAGTRTTRLEVDRWRSSFDRQLLTVQLEDKFGSMGTVCVVVVRRRPDAYDIPVFVLSCRVFGFGVETLVLEYLKRMARKEFGDARLRGCHVPNGRNAPCSDMYREHGFVPEGNEWLYAGASNEKALPSWLTLDGFDV